MIRKWVWIREYCKRQGFKESAEIADQIDRVLCYLYGEVDTKEWEEYVQAGGDGINETGEVNLSQEDVRCDIVASSRFCIACEVEGKLSSDLCRRCMFNELTGRDGDNVSLYEWFFIKMSEELERRERKGDG